MDARSEIREFLTSRRAKLKAADVGLPDYGPRRVPGLRREEVAVLAGVSTEWYSRPQKGHIGGVSEEVLAAVATALRLDEEERTYLFDLARAARPANRTRRRRTGALPPNVQWLLDSMTLSAALVTNGRMDILAINPLGRALYAPMLDRGTAPERGTANIARFHFLDPAAHGFYADWDTAADAIVALLRAEAGRYPNDKALCELVGDLSVSSPEFRTRWAAHNIRMHHGGVKRFRHPEVGPLELTYQSLDLPTSLHAVHTLTTYVAEPGSASEDRVKLLASWAAPSAGSSRTSRSDGRPDQHV